MVGGGELEDQVCVKVVGGASRMDQEFSVV